MVMRLLNFRVVIFRAAATVLKKMKVLPKESRRAIAVLLLCLVSLGCSLPSLGVKTPITPPGNPREAVTQPPMAEPEIHQVVVVRWSFSSATAPAGLSAGSTARVELQFTPSILRITRRPDGSIAQSSSVDWKDHPVNQMRYCLSAEKPCVDLGALRPFQAQNTIEVNLDWLGVRLFNLSVDFRDREGKPVPATDGWKVDQQSSGVLVLKQNVTTALNLATPLEKQPPLIQTAVAATRAAFPVVGSVKIEGSPCCRGGTAGSTIQIKVDFLASSTAGKVTEMRINPSSANPPNDLEAKWEPFVSSRSFNYRVVINWTTYSICVQYRDEKGNLSEIYCDSVGVEGSPVMPTPKK